MNVSPLFVYRTAKKFGKSKTVSQFSSSTLFTRKIAAITAAMAASSSTAIFVMQCLLVPGPRISTGVFLCRQSELFLSSRTNHSYSRIVDKKRALSYHPGVSYGSPEGATDHFCFLVFNFFSFSSYQFWFLFLTFWFLFLTFQFLVCHFTNFASFFSF